MINMGLKMGFKNLKTALLLTALAPIAAFGGVNLKNGNCWKVRKLLKYQRKEKGFNGSFRDCLLDDLWNHYGELAKLLFLEKYKEYRFLIHAG